MCRRYYTIAPRGNQHQNITISKYPDVEVPLKVNAVLRLIECQNIVVLKY